MTKSKTRRSQKAGLPQDPLIYTRDRLEKTCITIVQYEAEAGGPREITSWDEGPITADHPGVSWINVRGISQGGDLERLGECFKLHPLVLEDILNVGQRPKI